MEGRKRNSFRSREKREGRQGLPVFPGWKLLTSQVIEKSHPKMVRYILKKKWHKILFYQMFGEDVCDILLDFIGSVFRFSPKNPVLSTIASMKTP